MPGLWAHIRDRGGAPGGVASYPLDRLREEVAYLAYHLHWSYEEVIHMEHTERQEWVEEVARINTRLNQMGTVEEV